MRTGIRIGVHWTRALLLIVAVLIMAPIAEGTVTINEIRIDQFGNDDEEYVELAGTPGESLDDVFYIVIGDSSSSAPTIHGNVEEITDLSGNVIQPDGFFLIAESTFGVGTSSLGGLSGTVDLTTDINFENNDNVTHMLVRGLNAAINVGGGFGGSDLDADDDNVIDATGDYDFDMVDDGAPWSAIIDCVGLVETVGSGDFIYCPTTVGPDGTFVPAHVYLCAGTWVIGPIAGGKDTPDSINTCVVAPDVDNVIHRPLLVEPSEVVTVSADVSDQDSPISSVTIVYQIDGGGFVNQSTMSLSSGSTYTGTIPGQVLGTDVDYYVEALDTDSNIGRNPADAPASFYSYTVQNEVITSIADIHANTAAFAGSLVVVQAQVYCPGNYQQDGINVSAYIQDASNRGINIFGTNFSTGFADLNSTGNIVKVTGTVALFFTTVNLRSYDVELISSGNPPLTPAVQATTAAAALPSNEGTYIQASGIITAIVASTGSNPAQNYTVNDCSGPVVVRVDDDLVTGAPSVGDSITASGAGSNFQGQGDIIVCSSAEFTNHGPGAGDLCPPLLVAATLTSVSEVTAAFDESIDPTTGNTAGNYEVFETLTPANTITVLTAAVSAQDSLVVLTLAGPFSIGVDYTLRVNNVEDVSGNAIAPNSTVSIFDPNPQETIVITEIMQNPSVLLDEVGEWFEIRNDGTSDVDMDGWTIKDNGSDSHVINNGGPLMIAAGEYKVLGRSASDMAGEGVPLFYEYAGVTLANGDDELVLVNTSMQEVERVEWDGGPVWPDPNGISMQWNGTGDNNNGTNWYANARVFGSGDRGTPGAANDVSTSAQPPAMVNGLDANYPNPFNPRTTFSFTVEKSGRVTLSIYDVRGLKVRTLLDKELERGAYKDIVLGWPQRSGPAGHQRDVFLSARNGFRFQRE